MEENLKDTATRRVDVSSEEFCQQVADRMDLFPEDVRAIITCIEETIGDYLLLADKDHTIAVKVGKGLRFYSSFVPRHFTRGSGENRSNIIESRQNYIAVLSQSFVNRLKEKFYFKQRYRELCGDEIV